MAKKTSRTKAEMTKAHRHRFHYHGSTGLGKGTKIFLKCTCGETAERLATPEERLLIGDAFQEARLLHSTWYSFQQRFMNGKGTFRFKGYQLMERIEKWAKCHPDDVRVITVDDDAHASSILVLIEHRCVKKGTRYMGTTAIFVPQCTGEEPIRFFLYPRNLDDLLAALQQIKRQARPLKKAEQKQERERARALAKLVKNG